MSLKLDAIGPKTGTYNLIQNLANAQQIIQIEQNRYLWNLMRRKQPITPWLFSSEEFVARQSHESILATQEYPLYRV
jgi:hypothetical protein